MTKYLLSVHSVEGEVGDPMTDEEMRQSHQQLGILEEQMQSASTRPSSPAVCTNPTPPPSCAPARARW